MQDTPPDVVVVDDNLPTCHTLVRLLEKSGYHSKCIESGREAIQFLQACRPQIVFLDVMMPGVDGFEVLKAIRAHKSSDNVRVIMYSAMSEQKHRDRAMALGANGYIVKGGGFEDIRALLCDIPPST